MVQLNLPLISGNKSNILTLSQPMTCLLHGLQYVIRIRVRGLILGSNYVLECQITLEPPLVLPYALLPRVDVSSWVTEPSHAGIFVHSCVVSFWISSLQADPNNRLMQFCIILSSAYMAGFWYSIDNHWGSKKKSCCPTLNLILQPCFPIRWCSQCVWYSWLLCGKHQPRLLVMKINVVW